MKPYHTILTHPGGAHRDEFLACSVLLAVSPAPILRREATGEDLDDLQIVVVDVGHRHEPERNNFDHHHFPADHPPACSLSLVLDHLGLYADARQACEWLEPAEWFDCRGPIATAEWLGIERSMVNRLGSPMDATLLRRFARSSRLEAGDPLWEIMRMIGSDLLDYVRSVRERLAFVTEHSRMWTLGTAAGPAQILFLPRMDALPDDLSGGMEAFLETSGLADEVIGMVYPDRRNTGYGLSRFRDNPRLDFTRLAGMPGVHFTHARGFLAKTSATETDELRELLRLALV